MTKKKSDEITITLSPLQVEQVMRAAGRNRNGTVSNLLLAALDNAYQPEEGSTKNGRAKGRPSSLQKVTRAALEEALEDSQLSQSLLRGLAILASYGPDRPWRAIIDLAGQLGMSPSTTHRYVKTLRAVGLLEQNPSTREYRPVAV
jgi:IclR helix-turn-helix domain